MFVKASVQALGAEQKVTVDSVGLVGYRENARGEEWGKTMRPKLAWSM